ncbi:response regulator [uncultured Desulfosarcina sp.]|uniref:response regulator n=1 Tax=uncultured Desulfosarcina sp. TaxID=218289 RepID=UPI0029C63399|nr:response regulator [uncultured Desulfosarcina sp.]
MTTITIRHSEPRPQGRQPTSAGIEASTPNDRISRTRNGLTMNTDNNRVLVVDDDPISLNMVAKMAGCLGYRTATCQEAVDALSCLSKAYFKLVITDYDMPFMDGLELADEIKKKYLSIRIIMMSGHSPAQIRDLLAGSTVIDGLLFKPFNLKSLKESIEIVCGSNIMGWVP